MNFQKEAKECVILHIANTFYPPLFHFLDSGFRNLAEMKFTSGKMFLHLLNVLNHSILI